MLFLPKAIINAGSDKSTDCAQRPTKILICAGGARTDDTQDSSKLKVCDIVRLRGFMYVSVYICIYVCVHMKHQFTYVCINRDIYIQIYTRSYPDCICK